MLPRAAARSVPFRSVGERSGRLAPTDAPAPIRGAIVRTSEQGAQRRGASRWTERARRAAALALVALLASTSGCVVVEESGADSARARTSAGEVSGDTLAGHHSLAPVDAPVPPSGSDTLVALGTPSGAGAPGDSVRADSAMRGGGGRDAVLVAPTAAELGVLRHVLAVPVEGVAPADLRDSYEEGRGTRKHEALDIPAPRGTLVRSAADGRLLKLFTSQAGGLMVYALDPSGRFILMYAHLDAFASGLREGMTLRQGEPLGFVGTTGNAPPTVPHLHFAIARTTEPPSWWRGTPVNPYPLLAPAIPALP